MMPTPRPRAISINLVPTIPLLLLILLLAKLPSPIAPAAGAVDDDDDVDGLEELLAVDEELERQGDLGPVHSKEAEVLRRAQEIVVEIRNDNARKVVDGNAYVMVLGYAPWCERSAELMPRFAEAATRLREMGNPVVMAKVDAERYTKAAALFGIKGFPTLLLFVNGSSMAYRGGFTTEEILIWVRKKTGFPTIRLSSVAAAKEILTRHHEFVIGFFENFEGSEYTEFVKAATADDEIQFVETNEAKIAEVLFPDIGHKTNFLGLVKTEPEKLVKFDEVFEEGKILKFVGYNKFPLVTTMTELNSGKIYSSPIKLQIFLIADSVDFKKLLLLFQDAAIKFKTKIMFIYVDASEDNLAKPFLTLFGIESDEPKVVAFNGNIGEKYMLESDLTAENIDEFCSKLLHGALKKHFKSEPIPEEKEIVEKVVGKTFDAMVLDNNANVLLEIYTPWCMDCEAATKQVQKLAKHFEGYNDLIFARIDGSLNEHPKLQANAYPTLLFYPSGAKSNPIKISEKTSLKGMKALIIKHLKSEDDKSVEDQKSKDEL